jgi:hypothetical protein
VAVVGAFLLVHVENPFSRHRVPLPQPTLLRVDLGLPGEDDPGRGDADLLTGRMIEEELRAAGVRNLAVCCRSAPRLAVPSGIGDITWSRDLCTHRQRRWAELAETAWRCSSAEPQAELGSLKPQSGAAATGCTHLGRSPKSRRVMHNVLDFLMIFQDSYHRRYRNAGQDGATCQRT